MHRLIDKHSYCSNLIKFSEKTRFLVIHRVRSVMLVMIHLLFACLSDFIDDI